MLMLPVFLLPVLALQAPPLSQSTPDLRALAWIQGRWTERRNDELIEEHWSLVEQSLLGVSRTMKEGRSSAFELFTLERDGEDWVMRIRMFGPGLDKATRGKDEPLRLKLVEADTQHFRCEGVGPETGTALVYELSGPGRLTARITKTRDRKVVWSESHQFTRGQ